MTEKQTIIKDNKEAILAALNAYLDKIYNLSNLSDSVNKNNIHAENDGSLRDYITKLKNEQAPKFEIVRKKIINNDFKLSGQEIAYVSAALIFIYGCWETQINNLIKAKDEISQLIKKIRDKET